MNKSFRLCLCLGLVLSQGITVGTVSAETTSSKKVESTSSSSLFSTTDSSVEASTGQSQETKNSTESTTSTLNSTSATKTTPSATETTSIQENEPAKQEKKNKELDPKTTYLIEGTDIDAKFATLLRTDSTVQSQGTSWSGYGKDKDQLTISDMSTLTKIYVNNKNLDSLNGIRYAQQLTDLYCQFNNLTNLDVSQNGMLELLSCSGNRLADLDISQNTYLRNLDCSSNQLTTLDVTQNTRLFLLDCSYNQLTVLDVTNNVNLSILVCLSNQLTSLDINSQNTNLLSIDCSYNKLSDITNLNNLTNLQTFDVSEQTISIPVPTISNNNQASVDILKTTAHKGLTPSNVSIDPSPSFSTNGDQILLSSVTRESMINKSIRFSYTPQDLIEGSATGTKSFSGTINFFEVSNLTSDLKPNLKKVFSGGKVEWTWEIINTSSKQASNIYSELNLPVGLIIDQNSITKNGIAAAIDDLNGTNNLGVLDANQTIKFTFKTMVSGNSGEWLELGGKVNWEDHGARFATSSNQVKIIDDEQKDKAEETNELEIISVPQSFRYGIVNKSNTQQIIYLNTNNYQTNTSVVTDGFYTRIRDERSNLSGWKLTAQLSDFKDDTNSTVLTNSGIALQMENMKIESIKNRDTPQESIDQNPTGTPSTVSTNETLISGEAAKTLINARVTEGQGTWQLRIPFDKVSLTVPANTGEINKNYTATLTWSLDDTP
ncbi:WxL domain-containing protein [Enterococcus faecalis]|uniref:WxL domain-containing protein n=1 Tax=Enterococcus faecalis TaxID=1351 RepID=UPI001916C5CE|nr:WxL domain-containing protein [Enterococcus faecalis]